MGAVIAPGGQVLVGIDGQHLHPSAGDLFGEQLGRGDPLYGLLAGRASRIVDEKNEIIGLHAVERTGSPRSERIGEIGGRRTGAVFERHAEAVPRTDLVRFAHLVRSHDVFEHGNVNFLVAHGRIGIVEVLVEQFHKIGEHGRIGLGPGERRAHRNGGQIGRQLSQHGHIIGKSLFGHFRQTDIGRVGKIEILPIVPGHILGPLFGCGEQGRHLDHPKGFRFVRSGFLRRRATCACGDSRKKANESFHHFSIRFIREFLRASLFCRRIALRVRESGPAEDAESSASS